MTRSIMSGDSLQARLFSAGAAEPAWRMKESLRSKFQDFPKQFILDDKFIMRFFTIFMGLREVGKWDFHAFLHWFSSGRWVWTPL